MGVKRLRPQWLVDLIFDNDPTEMTDDDLVSLLNRVGMDPTLSSADGGDAIAAAFHCRRRHPERVLAAIDAAFVRNTELRIREEAALSQVTDGSDR
ncbi:MAG TPA: hypothetical protein VGE52_13085 [Pirellulales bacterium]